MSETADITRYRIIQMPKSDENKEREMTDPPHTHFVEINDIANTTHAINVNYIVVMIQDAAETYRVLLAGVTEPIHVDKANMEKISKVIGFSG